MPTDKNTVLLETLRRDKDNRQNLLFDDPDAVITCRRPADLPKCFRHMEAYRKRGFYLAGFFSYELGYFLEETLAPCCPAYDYPLLWMGVYRRPVRRLPQASRKAEDRFYLSGPKLVSDYHRYEKAIGKIKRCIAQGETYQINYTSRYTFDFFGHTDDFYDRLKQNQKVSYSALIRYEGGCIISLSPELFFRIDAKRNITVKPMKGTAPLSSAPGWLAGDAKNASENVMIVDLLRNDLGRICLPGSVRVKKLFEVEKYETLLQMTSTVTGRLQPDIGMAGIMKSLFPCGSVTGAPKIQSMKIIRNLEDRPRDIYTGAIGYFAPDGRAVFNVAIRTIDLKQRGVNRYEGSMGAGGGIVNDSRPEEEYAECRLKGQFLLNARPEFALIETMLLASGRIRYLNRHLHRLKASAKTFAIPCNTKAIRAALIARASELAGRIRLRLLLKSGGDAEIEHQPAPEPAGIPLPVALSRHRTDSADPFLRHKTTHRKLYDDEFKKYARSGYFDVLFLNEKNEITEGAISNVFVRIKGRWYTPPYSCGLLCGVARQSLIQKLNAREKILSVKDLKKAEKIVLSNAVRGATEVTFGG